MAGRGRRGPGPRGANEAGGACGGVYIFFPIVGWLFTAFAISLGAPFWYDFVNRIATIR